MLTAPVQWLGKGTLFFARAFGALTLVAARTVLHLPRLDRRELFRAIVHFGYRSLLLTIGVATLIGATTVLQAGVYAERFGARQYSGWAGGYAVLWEFGPLLLGLMMAARIGARNASELALMQINGQLEGLRGIGLDPFRLLVAPRVIAAGISVTALSALTFLVACAFEALAAFFTLKLPLRVFFGAFADMLFWGDAIGGICKSSVFGFAIALVSTTVGLSATGGARGVGKATASAVVGSCFALFALDFLITPPLTRLFS